MQFPEIPSNSRRMLLPLLSGYPWTTGTLQREDIRSIVDFEHEMAVRTPINAPASTNSSLYRFIAFDSHFWSTFTNLNVLCYLNKTMPTSPI